MDGLKTKDNCVLLKMVYFVDNVNFVTGHIFLFTLTTRKLRTKFVALI